jgi:hypothetical protein
MLLEPAATSDPLIFQAPTLPPSSANPVAVVEKPANALLKVPPGFEVKLFASCLDNPRLIRAAPNGDIFVAKSVAGRIRVLRPADGGDEVSRNEIFVSGLKQPFGIAFYPNGKDPQWVYVANTIQLFVSLTVMVISARTKRRKSSYPNCRPEEAIGPATLRSPRTEPRCSSPWAPLLIPQRRQAGDVPIIVEIEEAALLASSL